MVLGGGPHVSPDRIGRIVGHGLGSIAIEPAAIEAIGAGFGGTGEMPVAIPNLDPCVVAAFVSPEGGAGDAGGNADAAAGVGEDDGQPGATGQTLLDGFLGTLVSPLALGAVFYVDLLVERAIDRLDGFGGGFAVFDDGSALVMKLGAPRVAWLVELGVGQHAIEKQRLGYLLGPRVGIAGLHGQPQVFHQKFLAEGAQVASGHPGN